MVLKQTWKVFLQANEILKIQEDFCVDVNVEARIGRITLHGFEEDVSNAIDKVHAINRNAVAAQEAEKMMASMVEWCFLDASNVSSKLKKYPANINLQLEKALMKLESKTSFCDAQGNTKIVDLTSYEEYSERDETNVVKVIRKCKIEGEII